MKSYGRLKVYDKTTVYGRNQRSNSKIYASTIRSLQQVSHMIIYYVNRSLEAHATTAERIIVNFKFVRDKLVVMPNRGRASR